jgi:hypothetical protein
MRLRIEKIAGTDWPAKVGVAEISLEAAFRRGVVFEEVVLDKNSMKVSTCLCAETGKPSYLAINALLLITLVVYQKPAISAIQQSCVPRS